MAMLRLGGLKLDVRESCVNGRVVQHWDRFPRAVVHSLSFGVLKTELDKAMAELVLSAFLLWAGDWSG